MEAKTLYDQRLLGGRAIRLLPAMLASLDVWTNDSLRFGCNVSR